MSVLFAYIETFLDPLSIYKDSKKPCYFSFSLSRYLVEQESAYIKQTKKRYWEDANILELDSDDICVINALNATELCILNSFK